MRHVVPVHFGEKVIGDGNPCFITFEAGPTHSGLASAKRLATLAREAGADAIKFQMLDPDRLMADPHVPFSYQVLVDRETGRSETVQEPLYDLLKRRALSNQEWRDLKAHCDQLGLTFFATAGFPEEIDFLKSLGCLSIKIASADLNHYSLIRYAARTGLCLQIDTGNSSVGEVEHAVDLIRAEGNENIIIHHCPSGYPARAEGINLGVITSLRQMFPYPIAFSDHSPGWEMDVAAIALGANLVEKTITEDRLTRSVEHIMSIEPGDMERFVQVVRELDIALGQPRRILHDVEREKRKAVRRSAYLAAGAKAGTPIAQLKIEFRRPGFGMGPDQFESLSGAATVRDLEKGHQLKLSDLKWIGQ